MTNIRRYLNPGNTYFLTHVTHERNQILVENFSLLWHAMNRFRRQTNFDPIAWVVLPDHFHIVIDPGRNNLSDLMRRIKLSFSTALRGSLRQRQGRVWQYRFWDHVIRDQVDLSTHSDYVHYNPVKHGLVGDPFEWQYSSLHEYSENGYYARDWGVVSRPRLEGEFGE